MLSTPGAPWVSLGFAWGHSVQKKTNANKLYCYSAGLAFQIELIYSKFSKSFSNEIVISHHTPMLMMATLRESNHWPGIKYSLHLLKTVERVVALSENTENLKCISGHELVVNKNPACPQNPRSIFRYGLFPLARLFSFSLSSSCH